MKENYSLCGKEKTVLEQYQNNPSNQDKLYPGVKLLGEYLVIKNRVYLKLPDKLYINEYILNIEEGYNFGMSP